ncbi:MAG TPA: nucleotidyltransferase family protein [Candidatus Angelobacter sp.]|nr:nucleotidyltransferase family protein [Candidatus Angelobacter sp.]
MPRTAVVLSGGEGIRLRPITADLPKGLVKVGGKPLLQWVVEWLRANQVSNIVMGVAYLKDQITDFFGDGRRFGVMIQYSVHTVAGGTGEGFRLAIGRYVDDGTFFALNGDQITDLKLRTILAKHRKNNVLSTIAVVHPRLPFGLVKVDRGGYCRGFLEKPLLKGVNVSTGIYVFEREILQYLPRIGDVERTTFPKLSRVGKVAALRHNGTFITINSLRELEDAEKQLRSHKD